MPKKNSGLIYPLFPSQDGQSLQFNAFDDFTGKYYPVIVCPLISVDEINMNVDDDSTTIKLRYFNGFTDVRFDVPLTSVTTNDIINVLLSHSLIVEDIYAPELVQYIHEQVRNAPMNKRTFSHSSLGYHHQEKYGDMTFFADVAYNSNIKSTLLNNKKGLIGPHGSREAYDKMINEEVIPNINLQLAFVLGFASPLIPLISDKAAIDVVISNFSGISSTGKTTSLALMASVWGSGAVTNQGIIKTFFATNNSLINNLNDNVGFPVIFDDYETGNETAYGLTSLLFQIAQGESKGRSDISGKNKPTTSWKTLVALSGETSIFERAIKKQGLHARVLEFNDFAWTSSKQNSDTIKRVTRTNYGFYGPEFITKLASLSQSELENKYDEAIGVIEDNLDCNSGIESRVSSKLALIYMTAKLVKDLLNIQIDLNGLLNLLVGNEKDSRMTRDVYSEALEAIKEFINSNLSAIQNGDYRSPSEVSGRLIGKRSYDPKTGKINVSIIKSHIDNELLKRGFNDRAKILKKLAEMGYIIRDEDRIVRKVTIGFLREQCYKFAFSYESARRIVETPMAYNPVEPPTCECNFDDEQAINEIFDEDSNQ